MKTIRTAIDEEMILKNLFEAYPEHVPRLAEALLEGGVPCYGCHSNQNQTLQIAMKKAGLKEREQERLLERLHDIVHDKMEFRLTMTAKAAKKIKEMLKEHAPPGKQILKIHAEQGGCCGNSYGLMLVSKAEKNDVSYRINGITIVTDQRSAALVRDSTLDYVEGKQASGFQVIRFKNCSDEKDSCCGGGCSGC